LPWLYRTIEQAANQHHGVPAQLTAPRSIGASVTRRPPWRRSVRRPGWFWTNSADIRA